MKIPQLFDADDVLLNHSNDHKFNATARRNLKDAMYYLLNSLYDFENHQDFRRKFEKNGFFCLSSKTLQEICGNRYVAAIDILIKASVIESNQSYSAGSFSKIYALTGKHAGSAINNRDSVV